ncbi:hypothetical protein PMIN06_006140 [Paraphaeosphaeria minitans]|uniref:Ubiquitin-like modifier HUB1 n=1 Tax=Paraphaeosphaeria minitans TaxID=565426 RepID=A0A9P6G454_9PLEO|nr:hypothetical protein PMIN01_13142 [Paraphaeosphaeria minitans]
MPSPAPHPDRIALVEGATPRSPARKDARPDASSRARSRSRSPRKPKSYSGLKWKKPERSGDGERDRDRDDRRGGHDRDDRHRDDRDRERDRGYRSRDDRERRDRRDDDRRRDYRDDRDRRGRDRGSDRPRSDKPPRDKASKPAAAAAAPVPAATGEPMIIVTVNDRLGTKAQIPCMASDPVKVFKAMVAAKIGRPVHEIMLKRQGERPFHDQLSLADYGVSHGVQIDLELNTGD